MNGLLLKSKITSKGMSIKNVILKMRMQGVHISRTAFYRKMYGDSEFDRREIMAIAKVLELQDSEVMSIFFTEKVS